MDMLTVNSKLARKVPHWHELERLSKKDKIDIIALLSTSIANAENANAPKDRTREMIERCCGSWVGEQSAEKIIDNINTNKVLKADPI